MMRNPIRKQKIMAREMQIAPRMMSCILHDDLGLRAYKNYTRHLLTANLKEIRRVTVQKLLELYGSGARCDILFTDERIFDIKAVFNKQNDRVYVKSSIETREKVLCVQHRHHPTHVMVWLGDNWRYGFTDVHFSEQGVKTSSLIYLKMLE